jgi:hypothetical protein
MARAGYVPWTRTHDVVPRFAARILIALALSALFAPSVGQAQLLIGAGDIAYSYNSSVPWTAGTDARMKATAAIISQNTLNGTSGTVFTLGDDAYFSGTITEFNTHFQKYWGAEFKPLINPVMGNHEQYDPLSWTSKGYFQYFGAAAHPEQNGYYSYDVGSWHIIVLVSCAQAAEGDGSVGPPGGGCSIGSSQWNWLLNDLNTHQSACTLAMWHHPAFLSPDGVHPENAESRNFFTLMYNHGVDLVLNGHAHLYERFLPQTPDRQSSPSYGVPEIVVGTGGMGNGSGSDLNAFTGAAAPNSAVRLSAPQLGARGGVIRLDLAASSLNFAYLAKGPNDTDPVTTEDSGTILCHAPPPPAAQTPACGDGICEPGVEDCGDCPTDCPCWDPARPICQTTPPAPPGHGFCVANPGDGHVCGDGICAAGTEDCAICAVDCPCWDPANPVCISNAPAPGGHCGPSGNPDICIPATCGTSCGPTPDGCGATLSCPACDPCKGSTNPCCGNPDPCCGSTNPCCGSTDPCCGSTNPCCGNPDPCCGNPDPCCGSSNPCCGSTDPCCGSTNPCCGNPDPCCGSTDPCCGSTNVCCGNPDPCCGSSDPCCGSTNPCCGNPDPCCANPDPCCGNPDPCCGNPDPCCANPCTF